MSFFIQADAPPTECGAAKPLMRKLVPRLFTASDQVPMPDGACGETRTRTQRLSPRWLPQHQAGLYQRRSNYMMSQRSIPSLFSPIQDMHANAVPCGCGACPIYIPIPIKTPALGLCFPRNPKPIVNEEYLPPASVAALTALGSNCQPGSSTTMRGRPDELTTRP